MKTSLPTDSAERKEYPMAEGCLDYFPAALAGVARHSKLGNDKHNPGQPLHWSRGKSGDHANCIVRHLVDLAAFIAHAEHGGASVKPEHIRALIDEANALVWRSAALSQELHEKYDGAPLPPRAWADTPPPPAVAGTGLSPGEYLGLGYVSPQDNPSGIGVAFGFGGGLLQIAAGDRVRVARVAGGPIEPGPLEFKCDLSKDKAPVKHCYCGTCVRIRSEAAVRT